MRNSHSTENVPLNPLADGDDTGDHERAPRRRSRRPFVARLRAVFDINNIPLPFMKATYGRGEEWIKGILLCMWGAGIILSINIILTVIAVGMAYTKPDMTGIEMSVVYRTRCSIATRWKTGLHVLINVLSTGLLATSSYVMQCLCAPTREDLDRAHLKGSWLDVGTLSMRNFTKMDARRKLLWVTLLLSSLPMHMLFNSAVFSSIIQADLALAAIPVDLAIDEPLVEVNTVAAEAFFNATGFRAESIQDDIRNGTLRNLSLSDCYRRYNTDMHVFSERGALLLVATDRRYEYEDLTFYVDSNDTTVPDLNSIWRYEYNGSRNLPYSMQGDLDHWTGEPVHWHYPVWAINDSAGGSREVDGMPDNWQIDSAFYYQQRARYQNGTLSTMSWVDINTLFKYIYIYNPDEPQLRNYLDTSSIWNNRTWAKNLGVRVNVSSDGWEPWRQWQDSVSVSLGPRVYPAYCLLKETEKDCEVYFNLTICLSVIFSNVIKLVCMYQAAKIRRREVLLTVGDAVASFLDCPDATTTHKCLIFLTCLGVVIYLYNLGLRRIQGGGYISYPLGENIGIGVPTSQTLILEGKAVTAVSLIVISPQLVLSVLYYFCNGILSPLRVSSPRGAQRPTYYLSIPWRYSIPLLATSATLHWLLSQSLFLVIVYMEWREGHETNIIRGEGGSFSLFAIFLTLVIDTAAMLTLIALAMRPLRSHMPMAASCSAPIAAACHPPEDDTETSLKPVMWGEVAAATHPDDASDGSSSELPDHLSGSGRQASYAHCSFTSKATVAPSLAKFYR
ncbi:hypothetical protein BJY04DRAFT_211628 [Aspergillus karnatakaensis]|uniref:uncharacterized protein n=1 Tax=Aspergillus karnatakaensis TaxID=1810916 RepID=UPI003CCDFF24